MPPPDPTAGTVLGEEALPDRIRAKIAFGPECWIWTASQGGNPRGSPAPSTAKPTPDGTSGDRSGRR